MGLHDLAEERAFEWVALAGAKSAAKAQSTRGVPLLVGYVTPSRASASALSCSLNFLATDLSTERG